MKKKKQTIGLIESTEIFQSKKPRYNAFQQKTGAHGDFKYNRNKQKKISKKLTSEY